MSIKPTRIRLFIAGMMLCIAMLTGCSKQSEIDLQYEDMNQSATMRTESVNANNLYQNEYFFQNRCVIPVNFKQKKDSNLSAASVIRVDTTDSSIVYSYKPYKKLYPASITKLFTAYVVLKYGNLEDEVTVSYNAANITEAGAKKCGLQEGDRITMDTLLTSFLVYSGNDAGIAIAEHISGSVAEFTKKMNEEAKAIGAVHSNFVNPHGLHDDNHYTTAYDIYLILNELKKNEKFLEIVKLSSYKAEFQDQSGKKITKLYESTNQFITGDHSAPKGVTVIGGKTGTTEKAGSCLSLITQSDGHEYISVILKASGYHTIFDQMSHLIGLQDSPDTQE